MDTRNYSSTALEPDQLRLKRLHARLPGEALCRRAKISRSRLSAIERGTVVLGEPEAIRIAKAIDELSAARDRLRTYAAELGCPELL